MMPEKFSITLRKSPKRPREITQNTRYPLSHCDPMSLAAEEIEKNFPFISDSSRIERFFVSFFLKQISLI